MLIATVALYIATKMDAPKQSKPFIDYINNKRFPKSPEKTFDSTKSDFFELELKILIELDFDFEIPVPRTYLINFDVNYKSKACDRYIYLYGVSEDRLLVFDQIWAFFIDVTSKLLNDTSYAPL